MAIKHAFVNPKADGGDATIVRPSNWNADHDGLVAFQYTVTGAEPDLANLVIALPSAEPSASYAVHPAQEQFTNLLAMGVLTASKTTTQFVLSLAANATAGDVFSFLVTRL